jgi:hypothetical protein
MRLVTFALLSAPTALRLGALVPSTSTVVDLTASVPGCPPTMRGFLAAGEEMLRRAASALADEGSVRLPLSDVVLKAPIYDGEKLVAVGMNYMKHIEGACAALCADTVCVLMGLCDDVVDSCLQSKRWPSPRHVTRALA